MGIKKIKTKSGYVVIAKHGNVIGLAIAKKSVTAFKSAVINATGCTS